MTDKAYIVANEDQELRVLNEFEKRGYCWINDQGKPISSGLLIARELGDYPLFIGERFETKTIYWQDLSKLVNEEIVYDGRKENKMKIPENIYNMLVEWRDALELKTDYVTGFKLHMLNDEVHEWAADVTTLSDNHNRYIAILQWLNGEDVFEVEKPKKWVVRSKGTDDDDNYSYVFINLHNFTLSTYHISNATKFDTKEEAESWANAHQEVIEVEE